MKKVGLFFGSFNPIHIGHIIIANHLAEHSNLNEVWFVVTPLNPFKDKKSLLNNYDRLEMVHRALKKYEKLYECDIEFRLPQPNYTIDTLAYLEEKYPNIQFSLLMGEDNLKTFHKWKNYDLILKRYSIFVYPRISQGDIPEIFQNHSNIFRINSPIIELSASFIRKEIALQKNTRPLLPPEVWEYIDQKGFYQNEL